MSEIIDFHSHILPNVDDGSQSIEQSLMMLGLEARQGISRVVATPHFYPRHDTPERFLRRRYEAEMRLREALQQHPQLPEISIGAEVYFYRGISNSEAILELTIDKKGCILIEMPCMPWSDPMLEELEMIHSRFGLTPIVAHIDRYISPFRSGRMLRKLEELPVLVQANADFFLDRATRHMALRMLKQDRIQLLGSDCHNLDDRKPNLGDAVKLIQDHNGPTALRWIEQYQQDVFED